MSPLSANALLVGVTAIPFLITVLRVTVTYPGLRTIVSAKDFLGINL